MTKSHSRVFPAAALSLGLLLALAGCGDSGQKAASPPPPPVVTVAKPVQRSVTDHGEYVGRFVAVDSVEIRSRVSGYLDKVHFQDGQMVKEGDLLFTIDRRPFENALAQARANLAQARANLAFADTDLARGAELVRQKTITEQTFDQRTQAKRVAEASVSAQEAVVRQAELDLAFTELHAPVSGRIGDRRVSPGNLVTGGASFTGGSTGGGATVLATIVSLDPIRFEFTFDEASYLAFDRANIGAEGANRGVGVPVSLKLIDEPEFSRRGRMDFIDNVIDRASGTIRGRAVFDNKDGLLAPGMFGRVRLPMSAPYTALLIPDAAIGSEQVRKFVWVVDAENIARQRNITPGMLSDGLRVIKSGLEPDDRIIVNGQMRARAGQKVNPREERPAAPASPAAQAAPAVRAN